MTLLSLTLNSHIFTIFLQVTTTIEIFEDRFVSLLKDGAMIIFKNDVQNFTMIERNQIKDFTTYIASHENINL